jgi:hypothetical protein
MAETTKEELIDLLREVVRKARFDGYSDDRIYCTACGNWDWNTFGHISHRKNCVYKQAMDMLSRIKKEIPKTEEVVTP